MVVVWLVVSVVIVLLSTAAQAHPHPKHRFYDAGVLPDNREATIHLLRGESKRIFYMLESHQRPLTIIVTPCSSFIRWSLSIRNFPGIEEEGPWSNLIPVYDHQNRRGILTSYYGQERHTFFLPQAPSGLYVLELESLKENTKLNVLASSSFNVHASYPEVPTDSKVKVLRVKKNRILFTWNPVISFDAASVDYCVSANPRKPYKSHCSIRKEFEDDNFLEKDDLKGKSEHKKIIMIKDHLKNQYIKNDIHYECVGKKTWHSFNDLDEGKQYYLDVFAINLNTNTSSAYSGVNVSTKATLGIAKFKENVLTTLTLQNKSGFSSSLMYNVISATPKLWLFIQSCSGPGVITVDFVSQNRSVLNSEILDFRTIVIDNPPLGTLQMKISSSVDRFRKVQAWLSRKYHKFPFPHLPEDKRILAFESLSTCDSVTISWKAVSDEKVRYCIYKKPADVWRLVPPENRCEKPLYSDGQDRARVLCRRYHRFSKNRFDTNVIMQKIRGLEKGKTYVFDVQVTKFKGKTLVYDQVWVTTRRHCVKQLE